MYSNQQHTYMLLSIQDEVYSNSFFPVNIPIWIQINKGSFKELITSLSLKQKYVKENKFINGRHAVFKFSIAVAVYVNSGIFNSIL